MAPTLEDYSPNPFTASMINAREFNEAFGNKKDPFLYQSLIEEELEEWADEADPVNKLKEFADVMYVVGGWFWATDRRPDFQTPHFYRIIEVMDWGRDTYSLAVLFEAVERVHDSNMSKLNPATGHPDRDETGKVLKGPDYRPADLRDLVRG